MYLHRGLLVFVVLGALVLSVVSSGNSPSANSSSIPSTVIIAQFNSEGHILGFGSDEFFASNAAYALHVKFVGANPVALTSATPVQATDRSAPRLSRVTYPNLWDDITLAYDTPKSGIVRSTYTLAPFARVEHIRLQYNAPVAVRSDGTLSIGYATGQVSESAPVAWQEISGHLVEVAVAFVTRGDREVGFALGEYDPRAALVIDPTLTWNTFLGGTGFDDGREIAVDWSGNVYVTGFSEETWGTPVRPHVDGSDAFVAKLDANGVLKWNTFLGGSDGDNGYGIAVDSGGNVYVTGESSESWGSPIRPFVSLSDAFVAKLDSNGTLLWNTFLGGDGGDVGVAVVRDDDGNLYIAGRSFLSWGTPVRAFTIGTDAFAAKLDPNGALAWNTFLGGSSGDMGTGIGADGSGNVYVAGDSGNTWGTPIRPYTNSILDTFAAKLDSDGELIWNTFLGGSEWDNGSGIAVDGSGNVYVAGVSTATWGNPIRAFTFWGDGFTAKLDSNGALTWNTFLGGSGDDESHGIVVDGSGNVYVSGYSSDNWGMPVRPFMGGNDAFVAKLDSSGVLMGNTFLGGTGSDGGGGIAVDGSRNVYVVGVSSATWGNPVRPYTLDFDAFVAKIPDIIGCTEGPDKPSLINPRNNKKAQGPKVKLEWSDTACATTYKVIVKRGSSTGTLVFKKDSLTKSEVRTTALNLGMKYYWRVLAINSFGKTKSLWFNFTVK